MSLYDELKRRNVFRVAVAYIITAWLIAQVVELLLESFGTPDWVMKTLLVVLAAGFPFAMLFAWAFEVTPEGLKKEKDVDRTQSITGQTGRKLDFAIIAVLVVALVYFAWDKVALTPDTMLEAMPEPAAVVQKNVYYGPRNSIAVLPFVDMSPEKDQEYLSDGIAEELLNLLARIPDLQVTSRTSAFFFKGKDVDIPIIAERLQVQHILEGSVRKSGARVRITTQLIDVPSDKHLWSQTFDRTLDDVFAIQDEIAAAVVEALKVTLFGEAPKTAEIDPQAWSLYLEGRYFNDRRGEENLARAEATFLGVLEIEPGYAPAWVGLANTYLDQIIFGGDLQKGVDQARAAAQRALELDPESAEAHGVISFIKRTYDWDWQGAREAAQKGLELEPGNAAVLSNASSNLFTFGQFEEAIELQQEAIKRDPLLLRSRLRLGLLYEFSAQHNEALFTYRQLAGLNPEYPGVFAYRARVKIAQGKAESALKELDKEQEPFWKRYAQILVFSALERFEEADGFFAEMIEENAHEAAFQIAEIYAFRGEIDTAFEWLQRAYDQRDGGMTEIIGDYFLKNLEGDPRWEEMLLRMGLPTDIQQARD
jgi:TolB-like protein/Tfp pilus assembly protein PilF